MATEDEIRNVKRRHAPGLLSQPGVCGVGIEKDETGSYVLTVHLDSNASDVRKRLPDELEGHPVKYVVSGPFQKLPAAAKK